MSFYAGKDANFKAGSVDYPMAEYALETEAGRIDVTNFLSSGDWREFIGGFKSGRVTGKGPYDPTKALLTEGSSINFELTVGSTYKFTFSAVLVKARVSSTVDGSAQYEVEAQLTGAVTFVSS